MVAVTHDGMTVETNTGTEEQVRASMEIPAEGASHDALSGGGGDTPSDVDPTETVAAGAVPESVPAPAVEPKKAKPRDNPQARIAQEVEKRKASESRTAALEAELAQLRAQPAPKIEAKPEPTRTKPKEDEVGTKYQTYADFIEDLADWKAEQRFGAQKPVDVDALVEQKLAIREQQREQTASMQAHSERIAAERDEHADYDEKVDAADEALAAAGLSLSAAAAHAITSSEHSGSLVYWLATHPAEYLQLARDSQRLDVAAAPIVRQLLETRLGAVSRSGSAPAALTSRAKPPIKPVGASPPTASADDGSDDESFDRFFSRENAKDRKAGRL